MNIVIKRLQQAINRPDRIRILATEYATTNLATLKPETSEEHAVFLRLAVQQRSFAKAIQYFTTSDTLVQYELKTLLSLQRTRRAFASYLTAETAHMDSFVAAFRLASIAVRGIVSRTFIHSKFDTARTVCDALVDRTALKLVHTTIDAQLTTEQREILTGSTVDTIMHHLRQRHALTGELDLTDILPGLITRQVLVKLMEEVMPTLWDELFAAKFKESKNKRRAGFDDFFDPWLRFAVATSFMTELHVADGTSLVPWIFRTLISRLGVKNVGKREDRHSAMHTLTTAMWGRHRAEYFRLMVEEPTVEVVGAYAGGISAVTMCYTAINDVPALRAKFIDALGIAARKNVNLLNFLSTRSQTITPSEHATIITSLLTYLTTDATTRPAKYSMGFVAQLRSLNEQAFPGFPGELYRTFITGLWARRTELSLTEDEHVSLASALPAVHEEGTRGTVLENALNGPQCTRSRSPNIRQEAFKALLIRGGRNVAVLTRVIKQLATRKNEEWWADEISTIVRYMLTSPCLATIKTSTAAKGWVSAVTTFMEQAGTMTSTTPPATLWSGLTGMCMAAQHATDVGRQAMKDVAALILNHLVPTNMQSFVVGSIVPRTPPVPVCQMAYRGHSKRRISTKTRPAKADRKRHRREHLASIPTFDPELTALVAHRLLDASDEPTLRSSADATLAALFRSMKLKSSAPREKKDGTIETIPHDGPAVMAIDEERLEAWLLRAVGPGLNSSIKAPVADARWPTRQNVNRRNVRPKRVILPPQPKPRATKGRAISYFAARGLASAALVTYATQRHPNLIMDAVALDLSRWDKTDYDATRTVFAVQHLATSINRPLYHTAEAKKAFLEGVNTNLEAIHTAYDEAVQSYEKANLHPGIKALVLARSLFPGAAEAVEWATDIDEVMASPGRAWMTMVTRRAGLADVDDIIKSLGDADTATDAQVDLAALMHSFSTEDKASTATRLVAAIKTNEIPPIGQRAIASTVYRAVLTSTDPASWAPIIEAMWDAATTHTARAGVLFVALHLLFTVYRTTGDIIASMLDIVEKAAAIPDATALHTVVLSAVSDDHRTDQDDTDRFDTPDRQHSVTTEEHALADLLASRAVQIMAHPDERVAREALEAISTAPVSPSCDVPARMVDAALSTLKTINQATSNSQLKSCFSLLAKISTEKLVEGINTASTALNAAMATWLDAANTKVPMPPKNVGKTVYQALEAIEESVDSDEDREGFRTTCGAAAAAVSGTRYLAAEAWRIRMLGAVGSFHEPQSFRGKWPGITEAVFRRLVTYINSTPREEWSAALGAIDDLLDTCDVKPKTMGELVDVSLDMDTDAAFHVLWVLIDEGSGYMVDKELRPVLTRLIGMEETPAAVRQKCMERCQR